MYTVAGTQFDCPGRDELEGDDHWWEIYRDSFPANEREPASAILDALRRQTGIAFRACIGRVTAGIATTHLLLNPPAVFLVYLAIDQARRGAGLGGALLEYAWTVSRARLRERGLNPFGMIWEVDSPDLVDDPDEETSRERRISFFRRHGGVPVQQPYVQPPVDGKDPVPMQLMLRPREQAPDGAAPDQTPDQTMTNALVRAMYFEKYGAVNGIPASILTNLLSRDRIRETL